MTEEEAKAFVDKLTDEEVEELIRFLADKKENTNDRQNSHYRR